MRKECSDSLSPPDFEKSGRYYINYTSKDSHSNVVRFVAKDGKTTDPESGEVILRYEQDFGNHNGGWLDFGPDGMLWIATGDGGSANDPKARAQDVTQLLGKVLRLDVSGAKGYKLQRTTDLQMCPMLCRRFTRLDCVILGDPRLTVKPVIFGSAMSAKGNGRRSTSWRRGRPEGRTSDGDCARASSKIPNGKVGGKEPKNHIEPVYVYEHGNGSTQGLSVTGGFVYRGDEIPELSGRYVFADYQNPRIWSFELKGSKATGFKDHTD